MQKKEGKELESSLSDYFAYKKEPITPKIERTKIKGSYTIDRIMFSSYLNTDPKNDTTTMHFYRPKLKENTPAVVVLPTMSDNYFYSKTFSKFLVNKGFSALRVEKKNLFDLTKEDSLFYSKQVLKQMVMDTMRGIDWLTDQEYVDKEKLGVAGLSLGAILSSLVAANDKRIKAGVFMFGGGGLVDILSETTEPHVEEFRERLFEKMGWTLDDFKKELSEHIHEVEPLNYASKLDSSKYLMINGKYDKIIAIDAAEKLWREMGKPSFIKLHSGHYAAILFIPYLNYKMLDHFKNIFGEEYVVSKTRRFKKWISNYRQNRKTSKKQQENSL